MVGFEAQARFTPEECMDTASGLFVRIKPWFAGKHSVCQMVWESNDMAPAMDAKARTLALSKGYQRLIKLRNDASVSIDAQPDAKPRCTLFAKPSGADDADRKGKKHKPRDQQRQERDDAAGVSIKINVDDGTHSIDVLKAICNSDALYLKHDMLMVGFAIKYMRDEGFEDPSTLRRRNIDLPIGIYRPSTCNESEMVVAKMKRADGTTKYKKTTLEGALEWQQQVANGMFDDDGEDSIQADVSHDEGRVDGSVDVDTPPVQA